MSNQHRLDHTPFIVPPEKKIRLADYDPGYTAGFKNKKEGKKALKHDVKDLAVAQELLWASKQYAVLIIFQAMDAAGKDGTIKHVMTGVNPQGVDVYSFKAPTEEEKQFHFLMRPMRKLPAHGRINIFNRSYYEEVLVVRVHPNFLESQWMPRRLHGASLEEIWQARYESINAFEQMVANQDTLTLKFFLHVSKEEQLRRFMARLETPGKEWKFSIGDYKERQYWDDYQQAFEDMLNATSTEIAPWYVIPADNKWFMRSAVADIIANRIQELDLQPPTVPPERMKELEAMRHTLAKELGE